MSNNEQNEFEVIPGLLNSVNEKIVNLLSDKDEKKEIDESRIKDNLMTVPPKNNSNLPILQKKGNPIFEMQSIISSFPENKRRTVNKILFKNNYFNLIYNVKSKSLSIQNNGDIVYSAIPYDTARNFIQRAAVQHLLYPEATRAYIEKHYANLQTYISLGLFQITGNKYTRDSFEVKSAYHQIFKDPLFEIQVLGRLIQHDETGPISANIAGKFLYSENQKTGISAYLSEYIKFIFTIMRQFPIATDGKQIELIDTGNQKIDDTKLLTPQSDISQGFAQLPENLQNDLSEVYSENELMVLNKPILRSEQGAALKQLREGYQAHSIHPNELTNYFDNVLPTESYNQINVVSDIHSARSYLPFTNKNFNIIAGNIFGARISDTEITGAYVIGNHDLEAVFKDEKEIKEARWDDFRKQKWFDLLLNDPNECWPLLPLGNHKFYDVVQKVLQERFPNLLLLNNACTIYQGVRYVGLTIPVVLNKRKAALQDYIFNSLNALLNENKEIPTVIISSAPLFNELSMLSKESQSYKEEYFCDDERIIDLFKKYRIIGAIHGHHSISATRKRYEIKKFAQKELFVVCSRYSKINTGFELIELLEHFINN